MLQNPVNTDLAESRADGDWLLVAEVLGPTLWGEAPSAGQRASVVRLGGCNLACIWCDQPHTWDAASHDLQKTLHRIPIDEVAEGLRMMGAPLVVITGGEPLLQGKRVARLVEAMLDSQLPGLPYRFEVETNGTLPPLELSGRVADSVRYVVSPKLSHAGVMESEAIDIDTLKAYANLSGTVFKMVVSTVWCPLETRRLVEKVGIPGDRVYLMPEVRDAAERRPLNWVADFALAEGYNMTDRLRLRIWGDDRLR